MGLRRDDVRGVRGWQITHGGRAALIGNRATAPWLWDYGGIVGWEGGGLFASSTYIGYVT
ncbi:MAG TPA: hypothetical protein PK819_10600 [Thermomicrobiales bacterium]|nr:hypothetical protein [Thermomicrobiales bacterium]